MSAKPFVDTNVLIYAVASHGPEAAKGLRARTLLQAGAVCLSTQVLGEFYRAVTSARRDVPLTHAEAVAWVQLWKHHEVASITTAHVDLALEIRERFRLDYYDALIVAAARLAGYPVIYSEDLSHGQDYGGVRLENPFRDDLSIPA
jgi:predicted nucleic acid-binding protein